MEANLAVDFKGGDISREDIDFALREIEESDSDTSIEVVEPKGAFPTLSVGETLTLIIAINSTVQVIAQLYPKLGSKMAELGGDTQILNLDEISIGYLIEHTRVTRDKLQLKERKLSGKYITFVYEYTEDNSQHYIKINRENPTDWEYYEE